MNFTTVVAVDKTTSKQFAAAWPIWTKLCPMLLEQPLLLLMDIGTSFTFPVTNHSNVRRVYWNWQVDLPQRERMLTAFVKLPPLFVGTEYWLKIDTDVFPTKPGFRVNPDWFAGDPAMVASPWHYTKPGCWINELEEWAKGIPDLASKPPLGLHCPEGIQCLGHRRVASWLCFINTEWSKEVANYCPDRLPVPSQDTFHWYCAARAGRSIKTVSFKKLGWVTEPRRTHRARLEKELLCLP